MKRQTGTDKVSSATRGATVMSSSCLLAGLCPTDLVTFTFQDQCQVCTHSRTVSYRHCHLYVPGSMSGMYTLPDCVLQTLSLLRSRINDRYVHIAGLCPTDLVTFTFQDQWQVCTHSRIVSYRPCHLYVPGSMSGMYA